MSFDDDVAGSEAEPHADASRPSRAPLYIVAALLAALFVFAFAAAPHACEWGLNAYFGAGVVIGTICVGLPFLRSRAVLFRSPLLSALTLGAGCFVVWLGGLLASDFRLLCRLF